MTTTSDVREFPSFEPDTGSLNVVIVVSYPPLPTNSQPLTLFPMAGRVAKAVPHLMTLADLSPSQINGIVSHAHNLKHISLPWLSPQQSHAKVSKYRMPSQSLFSKSIALLFSKRSTRTRLSAETSALLLGGKAIFLGKDDIQLGVNESAKDTARVIGGMCQGVFARVGDHSEIEVSATGLVCTPIITQNGFPRNLQNILLSPY